MFKEPMKNVEDINENNVKINYAENTEDD